MGADLSGSAAGNRRRSTCFEPIEHRTAVECRSSAKGAKTVKVLRLDRREAMSASYLKSYRRLAGVVQVSTSRLASGAMAASELLAALREADDHGLLAWCFGAVGQHLSPFSELRVRHPPVWVECLAAVQSDTSPI